jgi:hypothetical protein
MERDVDGERLTVSSWRHLPGDCVAAMRGCSASRNPAPLVPL